MQNKNYKEGPRNTGVKEIKDFINAGEPQILEWKEKKGKKDSKGK